jgi:hypothetical protein
MEKCGGPGSGVPVPCPSGKKPPSGGGKPPSGEFSLDLLVSKWVGNPDAITADEKESLRLLAAESKTSREELIRISRRDEKHQVGDIVDFSGPTSFSGAVQSVLAGKPIGHLGWKSSDKAIYQISKPKRGFDVDYSKVSGISFSADGEKETIVSGKYRVVRRLQITEPGTRPSQGYTVPSYILEEV